MRDELATVREQLALLKTRNVELAAANRHLSDVVQQLHLDLEWAVGRRKDWGNAPTLMREKYTRVTKHADE